MDHDDLWKQYQTKPALSQRQATIDRLAASTEIRYVVNLYAAGDHRHHRAVKTYKARHWISVYEGLLSPSSPPNDAAVVEIIDLEKYPEHPNRSLDVEVQELDDPPFFFRATLELADKTWGPLREREIRVPWKCYLGLLGVNGAVLAELAVRDERYDTDYDYILRHPHVMTKEELAVVLAEYAGQDTGLLLGIVYDSDTEVFRGPLPECLERLTTAAHRVWSYELLAHDAEYCPTGGVV